MLSDFIPSLAPLFPLSWQEITFEIGIALALMFPCSNALGLKQTDWVGVGVI